MTVEHDELKGAMAKLTDATNSLTNQIAVLNSERATDHRMIQDHQRILNGSGTVDDPGLVAIARETRNSLADLQESIKKALWIIITPVLGGAVVIFIIALSMFWSKTP